MPKSGGWSWPKQFRNHGKIDLPTRRRSNQAQRPALFDVHHASELPFVPGAETSSISGRITAYRVELMIAAQNGANQVEPDIMVSPFLLHIGILACPPTTQKNPKKTKPRM